MSQAGKNSQETCVVCSLDRGPPLSAAAPRPAPAGWAYDPAIQSWGSSSTPQTASATQALASPLQVPPGFQADAGEAAPSFLCLPYCLALQPVEDA
jgi:hypothetical protein